MARILIAASEQPLSQLGAALTGNEILATTNLKQAARLVLEDGIDFFVVGVHFDDSRAMELVKLVRLNSKHRQTPILVIRLTPSTMPDVIQMTMEIMKRLDVINNYLELDGDPLAEIKIKDAVAELLANPKRLAARKVSEQDARSH